jgi:excisionase family DNA binding protein
MPEILKNEYANRLVSVAEAAHILGIGRTNLYSRINAKEIDAIRIGGRRLVKLASINAFIDRASEST